jgi:hypothetical protein
LTGGVQAWLLSSEITCFGLPTLWLDGEGSTVRRVNASGASDPRSQRTGVCTQTLCTETGRSQGGPAVIHGRSGRRRLRPYDRHERAWEVGRGRSICEASEQRCSTSINWPTTGGVRGEKAPGQGKLWTSDRDRHTEVGSNVERFDQGTRGSTNASASDPRQEPSAVVPHAWDLCGGCRETGIPTATERRQDGPDPRIVSYSLSSLTPSPFSGNQHHQLFQSEPGHLITLASCHVSSASCKTDATQISFLFLTE